MSSETDHRLRGYLNGDQPSRERMCIGILCLDRRFSDVEPRRPEGGPDGGRDIQFYRDGEKGFGAVGFKNDAESESSHKREIIKKFEEDVDTARKADADIKQFVFFTNMDLTESERGALEKYAANKGFTFVEIFYRERIRMQLDNPEGLSLRFQYLQLSLSDAEQQAFFSRYGKDLENLVHGRFDKLESMMDRLDFQIWRRGLIRRVSLKLHLENPIDCHSAELGHFRALLEIMRTDDNRRGIVIGGRDDYFAYKQDDTDVEALRIKPFFHQTNTNEISEKTSCSSESWAKPLSNWTISQSIDCLEFAVEWWPASRIFAYEFDESFAVLVATDNLRSRISRVVLKVDEFNLIDIKNFQFPTDEHNLAKPQYGWPEELTEEEKSQKWCRTFVGPIDFDRRMSLDFSQEVRQALRSSR